MKTHPVANGVTRSLVDMKPTQPENKIKPRHQRQKQTKTKLAYEPEASLPTNTSGTLTLALALHRLAIADATPLQAFDAWMVWFLEA